MASLGMKMVGWIQSGLLRSEKTVERMDVHIPAFFSFLVEPV
jgi:hypothetical protein